MLGLDRRPQIRALERTQPVLRRPPLPHDCRRKDAATLSTSAQTSMSFGRTTPRHRHPEFICLLNANEGAGAARLA